MKLKLAITGVLVLTAVALGQSLPKPSAIAPPLETKEISVPLDMAREYQVLDLKYQLAIEKYSSKLSQYLATPEMIALRQSVVTLEQGRNSKILIMADAAHIKAADYSKYRLITDDTGAGKFVLVQP